MTRQVTARTDLAHYLTTLAGDQTALGKTFVISTIEHAPPFWRAMVRQSFKSAQQ
jgi:hypothetical protein